VVNTASVAGLVGLPMGSHYVAAKHGVVGLTKTAAMEYAKDNIRVNCVNPGYVTSPMTAQAVETRLDAMMAKVPMGRMGTADEIAEGVVWMLSDRASFMTGASHVIDGGYYAA
jgi:NAD(P)-dependent dehydrogenase (short-subunit alcohol dehydrogenase family)